MHHVQYVPYHMPSRGRSPALFSDDLIDMSCSWPKSEKLSVKSTLWYNRRKFFSNYFLKNCDELQDRVTPAEYVERYHKQIVVYVSLFT